MIVQAIGVAALTIAPCSSAQTGLPAYERLTAVTSATSLIYVEKPWHLKLGVTLYPKGGQPSEEGVIERWQSGDDSKTISTFGSSSQTILVHNDHYYGTSQGSPVSDPAEATLKAVLHPGPYPKDLAGTNADFRVQSFGKENLDCIMLTRPMPRAASAPLGLFPTYCLTTGDHLSVTYDFGSDTVVRNQVGKFLDREVTTAVAIMEGTRVIARGRVLELSTFTPKADEFEPSPELAATGIAAGVSGSVMAGKKIGGSSPVYPLTARQNHISGTVVLNAFIGKDGRIHDLLPASAPDPDLALAAIAAVRGWTYKPYLLNGVPTDVNTTITVNFNLR